MFGRNVYWREYNENEPGNMCIHIMCLEKWMNIQKKKKHQTYTRDNLHYPNRYLFSLISLNYENKKKFEQKTAHT